MTSARPLEIPHTFFGVTARAGNNESGALHDFIINGIRQGRPFQPLVTYNTWFPYGTQVNEDQMVAELDRAAALGVELVVLDAGWYVGAGDTNDYDFESGLGTWAEDMFRFPSGIASLADYAHGLGLKFGIWVEPERVALAWVDKAGLAREPWLATRDGDYGAGQNAQICLAGAAGRQWVLDQLTALIDRIRPDYLKWDNNFWVNCNRGGHGHGAADGNLAHVQALYQILDALRRRYPDLLIENVSGGGARIDFGMLAYTDVAWMDDRTAPSSLVRHNIEGLTFAFPPAYLLSFLIDAEGEPIAGADDLPLLTRSRMPAVFGLTYRTDLLQEETAAELAGEIERVQTIPRHHRRRERDAPHLADAVRRQRLGCPAGGRRQRVQRADLRVQKRSRQRAADRPSARASAGGYLRRVLARRRTDRHRARRYADAGRDRAAGGVAVTRARARPAGTIAAMEPVPGLRLALRRHRALGLRSFHRSTSRFNSLIGSGLSSTWSLSTVSLCSQHAAVLLDDHHRRRLLPALVAAAGLAAFERRHQALRQVAGRLLERG